MRWQALASVLRLAVTFVRFVALARLLPVEAFGVYALAVSIAHVTATGADFGLAAAFLHRAPETEDEGRAAQVLCLLRLALVAAWAAGLAAAACVFTDGALRSALLALVACALLAEPAFVPRQILVRRVQYGRIALYDALDALVGTAVAVALALAGAGLWALLACNAVSAALQLGVFLLVSPPWRLRLGYDRRVAGYLLRFGSRGFAATALDRALERLPDLFVGGWLGERALGYYSRALRLAAYPRELLTNPLVTVLPATYAALGPRRPALAETARSSLALLTRLAAALAAVLFAAAPGLVEGLLGPRWRPAVEPLRVLCALGVAEPLRLALTGLLIAIGRPGAVARQRGVQLALLGTGLLASAALGSTTAVAWAVVLSTAGGVILLGGALRAELELPFRRIVAAPLFAAACAAGAALAAFPAGWVQPAAAAAIYAALLAVFDRPELARLARALRTAGSSK